MGLDGSNVSQAGQQSQNTGAQRYIWEKQKPSASFALQMVCIPAVKSSQYHLDYSQRRAQIPRPHHQLPCFVQNVKISSLQSEWEKEERETALLSRLKSLKKKNAHNSKFPSDSIMLKLSGSCEILQQGDTLCSTGPNVTLTAAGSRRTVFVTVWKGLCTLCLIRPAETEPGGPSGETGTLPSMLHLPVSWWQVICEMGVVCWMEAYQLWDVTR